ncbi:MAG: helix-turn-helix transcriptional regulator [Anaerolineales bacterium]
MKSTRTLILDYLETHRVAVASELSRALKVTPADVRHHLSLLEKGGLIEISGQRHPPGRGRPARLYRLSQNKLEENLGLLASALLEDAKDQTEGNQKNDTLQRIARRIAGGAPSRSLLSQRLFRATQRLNDLNYQARWEAHTEAPRVIFEHCPYAAILSQHPEICRLDAQLLEELLATPVTQVAKLARDARGATYCEFRVNDG